ncbi:TPA: 50S ribosome-binding GTPase [archaeon]|nr:50S ribosome-binding GTPase [Candidatus Undinarchaeales archaeon SRR5007147.bin71]
MVKKLIKKLKGAFSRLFGRKRVIRLGIYGEPNTGKTTLANKISMDWMGKEVGIVSEMPHETRTIQKVEHIEVKAGKKTLVMNLLDMPGLSASVDFKEFTKFKQSVRNVDTDFKDLKISDLKRIAEEEDLSKTGKKAVIIQRLKAKISKKKLQTYVKDLKIKITAKKGKKISKTSARKIAEEATKGIVEAIKWLDNVDSVIVMMDSTKDPMTQVNIMLLGNLEAKSIPIVIAANKIDAKNSKPNNIMSAFPQHPVVPISAKEGRNLENLYKTIAENV